MIPGMFGNAQFSTNRLVLDMEEARNDVAQLVLSQLLMLIQSTTSSSISSSMPFVFDPSQQLGSSPSPLSLVQPAPTALNINTLDTQFALFQQQQQQQHQQQILLDPNGNMFIPI